MDHQKSRIRFILCFIILTTILCCAFAVAIAETQTAMWIMDDLYITQVPGGDYSHAGTLAFDIKGANNRNVKAPFDGTIVEIFATYNMGNTVILQSNAPVRYANGTIDYMSIAVAHDNDISDCWIGKTVSQGQVYLQNGNYGQVTGVHSHVTVIAGKYTDHPGIITVPPNDWATFNNTINPTSALCVSDSTNIIETMGMSFSYANNDPVGHLDNYDGGVKSVYVRGWAQDPDAPTQSLTIHVYVGGPAGSAGASCHIISANKYRSDLGGNFGFEETITVSETGTQPVYVYAIDALGGDDHNPCIGSATVTITNQVAPTAISMDSSLTLMEGKSSTLSVSYTPSDTTDNCKGVTWSSSNEAVATVNSSGRVTGVAEGTAVITATSTYNVRLRATCTVTVTKAIPVPTIASVDVDGYNVHVTWNASPLTDENDVRTYTARLYRNYMLRETKTNLTDTFCDFTVPGAGTNYRVTVMAVNATNNTTSSVASQSFVVDPVITANWQEASTLPSIVTEENCDIEYRHTYRTTAQTSPGSGWSQVSGSGNTTYVNEGDVWETEFAQQTSETCVLVGSYYYHYCGTGYGIEHFEAAGFTTLHVAGPTDGSFQVVDTQKDTCHEILQYQLKHTAGQYAGQAALCNEGKSDWWYIKYQYQNKRAITTYTWEKTTDWQSTKDSSAYSVQYRFRLKDTAAPQVTALNVAAITPRDYTIACGVSDDVGIEKVEFLSWTENESEADAVVQEVAVENAPAETEVTATVAISSHGNAKDVTYYTKVVVYDVRGNSTEYISESGQVYMPTLMHSSSRKLTLPAALQTIESEAFEGSIAFAEVVLPEGVTTIGARAFAECGRLTLIYMPDSVEQIAANAFADSSNVVFLCASNNDAAAFARENHIPYFTGE